MKTIKERARELWGNLPIIQEDYISDLEDALKEQRAIDIDKACEWLKNNKDSDFINDEPCQFGGRAVLDDAFIEEFRKAMEE